jgi:hypothetical protein
VTDAEFTHLQKLSSKEPFPFNPGPETSFFLNELRRLRSLSLIDNPSQKGIRTLEREGGDVKAHFFITSRGEEYLQMRQQIEESDTGI